MGCCQSYDDDDDYSPPPQGSGPPPMAPQRSPPRSQPSAPKTPTRSRASDSEGGMIKASTVTTATEIRKNDVDIKVEGSDVEVALTIDSNDEGVVLKVYVLCLEAAGEDGVAFLPQSESYGGLHEEIQVPKGFGFRYTCKVNIHPELMESNSTVGKYPLVFTLEKPGAKQFVISYMEVEMGGKPALSRHVLCKGGNLYLLKNVFGGKEVSECVVCLSENSDAVIMPCRHQCVCRRCAVELKKQREASCPMCRTIVTRFIY
eukprot:TRINITY_DN9125_c0_g1_i1.p1 TRINITY_DN9125_c0_g1~~TRINITY_DN9125_c0_g1_i1.p1  ORF type:complete len:260 (+),score=55.98 TRINITY_DN9125_c0_g1_i1:41-820(+)